MEIPNDSDIKIEETKTIISSIGDFTAPEDSFATNNRDDCDDSASACSNILIRIDPPESGEKIIKRKIDFTCERESSQVEIFVNKFIRPEIKDLSSSPTLSIKSDKQLMRRTSRKQTGFNLMVIGEPGLGQNTFIHSVVSNNTIRKENSSNILETNEKIIGEGIVEKSFSLTKDTHRLCLNVIKIPEYGCGLKSDSTFSNILAYVDNAFKECFKLECSLNRVSSEDKTIHCCLYFISPYGHGLKPLDIEFMKLFQTKFNIIPIIAKSDVFTKSELEVFKENILSDLKKHEIKLFEYFNNCESIDDDLEDIQDMCEELKENIPIPIISSHDNCSTNTDERTRQYPWGVVKVDDPQTSNYAFLENILLKSHTNYFKTITKSIHYENYRVHYILERVN